MWYSVYASGTRVSGKRFTPAHQALDVAPNDPNDLTIQGQLDGVVEYYGNDDPIEQSWGSASRGIYVGIRHDDGTSVEHCHLAGVPWPVDGRYDENHITGNPVGRRITRGQPTGFYTGLTGDTSGYHDHLIARDANGQRVDPEPLLFTEEEPVPEPLTEYELAQLQIAWDIAEWLDQMPMPNSYDLAKAIKNAIRIAKGEAVER